MINLTLPDINGLSSEEALKKLRDYLYEMTDQVKNELNMITDATLSGDLAEDVAALQLAVSRINANLSDGLLGAVKKNAVIGAVNASSETVKINPSRVSFEGVQSANSGFTTDSAGSPELVSTWSESYTAADYDADDVTRLTTLIGGGDDPTSADMLKYDFYGRGGLDGLDLDICTQLAGGTDTTVTITMRFEHDNGISVTYGYTDAADITPVKISMDGLTMYDPTDDEYFTIDAHALKALLA